MPQLVRTTLRLNPTLKKAAEIKAAQLDTTMQALFNDALAEYLDNMSKKKAKKIVFKSQNIGQPLDNLTREDILAE